MGLPHHTGAGVLEIVKEVNKMLCFRCEHRSRFLEAGCRPRYECGDVKSSKAGCYMYMPVLPAVWEPDADKGDLRPIGSGMFARRSYALRISKGKLKIRRLKDGCWVSYWTGLK